MTVRVDESREYCAVTNMAAGYAHAIDALRQQLAQARVTRPELSAAEFLAERYSPPEFT